MLDLIIHQLEWRLKWINPIKKWKFFKLRDRRRKINVNRINIGKWRHYIGVNYRKNSYGHHTFLQTNKWIILTRHWVLKCSIVKPKRPNIRRWQLLRFRLGRFRWSYIIPTSPIDYTAFVKLNWIINLWERPYQSY